MKKGRMMAYDRKGTCKKGGVVHRYRWGLKANGHLEPAMTFCGREADYHTRCGDEQFHAPPKGHKTCLGCSGGTW
jgi:hypothetical protein